MNDDDDKIIPSRPGDVLAPGGNLVDRSSATLCIHGEDLDPEHISTLLRCRPTKAFTRGSRETPSSPPKRQGGWLLTVEGRRPKGPEDHIQELFMRLPADPSGLREIGTKYRTRVFIGIFMQDRNRGFSISPELLAKLAACGLELDFDIYQYEDHD